MPMLHMVRKAKETQKGTTAKNRELQVKNEELAKENHDLHLQQLHHQQRLYALEEQVKAMTRALMKERREHELTKIALELSRRTT